MTDCAEVASCFTGHHSPLLPAGGPPRPSTALGVGARLSQVEAPPHEAGCQTNLTLPTRLCEIGAPLCVYPPKDRFPPPGHPPECRTECPRSGSYAYASTGGKWEQQRTADLPASGGRQTPPCAPFSVGTPPLVVAGSHRLARLPTTLAPFLALRPCRPASSTGPAPLRAPPRQTGGDLPCSQERGC